MSEEDKKVIKTIHSIVDKGNNVEIKRNSDGTLKVYEVKKRICTR